jgi:hypothetical protein
MSSVRSDFQECQEHPQLYEFEAGIRAHPDFSVVGRALDDVLLQLGHPCHFCLETGSLVATEAD